MRTLFRGLMVPLFFLLYLALFAAIAAALVMLGPVVLEKTPVAELGSLFSASGGKPSNWAIAVGLAVAADLFIAMIAMLISERAASVKAFVQRNVKTAFWFALVFAGGFALVLAGQDGAGLLKWMPAVLLACALLLASLVTAFILAKPFLWWVSEKPRTKKRPRPPKQAVAPS